MSLITLVSGGVYRKCDVWMMLCWTGNRFLNEEDRSVARVAAGLDAAARGARRGSECTAVATRLASALDEGEKVATLVATRTPTFQLRTRQCPRPECDVD